MIHLDKPATVKAVNAALKRLGREEQLFKGDGYAYFSEGEP